MSYLQIIKFCFLLKFVWEKCNLFKPLNNKTYMPLGGTGLYFFLTSHVYMEEDLANLFKKVIILFVSSMLKSYYSSWYGLFRESWTGMKYKYSVDKSSILYLVTGSFLYISSFLFSVLDKSGYFIGKRMKKEVTSSEILKQEDQSLVKSVLYVSPLFYFYFW